MKIEFGNKTVAIYVGTLKDKPTVGCCVLQKLLFPNDENSIADIPVQLQFKDIDSLNALIKALREVRREMRMNEQKE